MVKESPDKGIIPQCELGNQSYLGLLCLLSSMEKVVLHMKNWNKFQIELTTRLALFIESGLEELLADSKMLKCLLLWLGCLTVVCNISCGFAKGVQSINFCCLYIACYQLHFSFVFSVKTQNSIGDHAFCQSVAMTLPWSARELNSLKGLCNLLIRKVKC